MLGASGKALLIDALAKNGLAWAWTPRGHARQNAVVDLFVSAKGRQLTRLKNCLDMDGSVHNLVSVVAQLSTFNRQKVLSHIETEAAKVMEEGHWGVKVLSDIDDTLFSSGGHFPAGCDKRWKKGRFYPGVFAFYRSFAELGKAKRSRAMRLLLLPISAQPETRASVPAAGINGSGGDTVKASSSMLTASQEVKRCTQATDDWRRIQVSRPANVAFDMHSLLKLTNASPGQYGLSTSGLLGDGTSAKDPNPILLEFQRVRECNLVFLSARPHVHRDVTENTTFKVFWNLVQAQRLQTVPSLLPGSICAGFRGMLLGKCSRTAWKSAGYQKLRCFASFAELYPEYKFVFVGDNGQADVLAAELMQQHSDQVLGCFMHEVAPIQATLTTKDTPTYETWKASGILFFRTYVGAALSAYQADLISLESLAGVAKEAVDDYYMEMHERRLAYLTKKSGTLQLFTDGLLKDLGNDLAAVNEVLAKQSLQKVDFPAAEHGPCTAEARKFERCAWQGCDGASSGSDDEADLEHGLQPAKSSVVIAGQQAAASGVQIGHAAPGESAQLAD
mmetsp:Transcript_36281/g.82190  ORF Transcript_36281/g.82190 Transcript_36281/m.82190 type:complete len:561 (-) Transcript_36281:238-1920(-)